MVGAECFSLSRKEKTVFLCQVSSQLPSAHAFKISQVRTWRKSLTMPQDWKLAIVYFLDKNKRQFPSGWFSKTIQSQKPRETKPSATTSRISLLILASWVLWSALQSRRGMFPLIPLRSEVERPGPDLPANAEIWITKLTYHLHETMPSPHPEQQGRHKDQGGHSGGHV